MTNTIPIPTVWAILLPHASPHTASGGDDECEYPVRSLWELYLPHAIPHDIPEGIGRVICDHAMGRDRAPVAPRGSSRIDSRTAYELIAHGRRIHSRRRSGAVTTKICEVLMAGPVLHSELINCIGPDPLDRRYARNGIRYLLEMEQIRIFIMED